jgi:hypothetical protein
MWKRRKSAHGGKRDRMNTILWVILGILSSSPSLRFFSGAFHAVTDALQRQGFRADVKAIGRSGEGRI